MCIIKMMRKEKRGEMKSERVYKSRYFLCVSVFECGFVNVNVNVRVSM